MVSSNGCMVTDFIFCFMFFFIFHIAYTQQKNGRINVPFQIKGILFSVGQNERRPVPHTAQESTQEQPVCRPVWKYLPFDPETPPLVSPPRETMENKHEAQLRGRSSQPHLHVTVKS